MIAPTVSNEKYDLTSFHKGQRSGRASSTASRRDRHDPEKLQTFG